MRIYVASSWRNTYQPGVVTALREAGHVVYDFRHPVPGHDGFRWSEIDPQWQSWTVEQYRQALGHPIAARGFQYDMEGLVTAEATVLVLPCGRSAHLELGYAVGQRQQTLVYMPEPTEPELMYKMVDGVYGTLEEVCAHLQRVIRLGIAQEGRGDASPAPEAP